MTVRIDVVGLEATYKVKETASAKRGCGLHRFLRPRLWRFRAPTVSEDSFAAFFHPKHSLHRTVLKRSNPGHKEKNRGIQRISEACQLIAMKDFPWA